MDGIVQMIVDLLRKKQDEQALGPNMAPPRPTPGMLGTGAAAQAGAQVSGRDKQIMDYVNQNGR